VGKAEFDNNSRRITLTLRDSVGEIVRPETPKSSTTSTAAGSAATKDKAPPAVTSSVAAAKGKGPSPATKGAPAAPVGFSSSPIQGEHVIAFDLPDYIPRHTDDLSLWQLMAVQHDPMLSEETKVWPDMTSPQSRQADLARIRARAVSLLHGRLATAFGCLGLVLLGAGLGMRFSSGNLLTAFGLAIGPWLMAYMLTNFVGIKAVAENLANPDGLAWIIWAPNVLLVILGAGAVAGASWIWGHPIRLRHRFFGRPAKITAPVKAS